MFFKIVYFCVVLLLIVKAFRLTSPPSIALTRSLFDNKDFNLLLTSKSAVCKVKCVELPCIDCRANDNAKTLSSIIKNYDAIILTSPKVIKLLMS